MISIFSRLTNGFRFSQSKIILTSQPPLGIINLNSPQDKNCLSIQMNKELSSSINKFSSDPNINLIILKSTVPRLFSAGGNLKYFYHATSKTFKDNDIFQELQKSLMNIKKPIVTVVDGMILGGAFQMALHTDMIICTQNSKFGMPQLKLGISTVLGASQRLPRILGKINTSKIILSTNLYNPQRLHQLGLITEIFQQDGFNDKVIQYCTRIASLDQKMLIQVKKMVRDADRDQKYKLFRNQ